MDDVPVIIIEIGVMVAAALIAAVTAGAAWVARSGSLDLDDVDFGEEDEIG
jgi:hypothetical protein